MKKKYVFGGLVGGIACAALGSFLTLGGIVYALGFSPENVQNIVRFVGIRKLIEARYVGDVDDTALMDGAISGMVQSLGDPHSLYMGPEMYEQLSDQKVVLRFSVKDTGIGIKPEAFDIETRNAPKKP